MRPPAVPRSAMVIDPRAVSDAAAKRKGIALAESIVMAILPFAQPRSTMRVTAECLFKSFVALLAAAHGSLVYAAAAPRMSTAEAEFRAANPCPATGLPRGLCKGYVVDRIIPVVCGGSEAPDNMQWQTLTEARAKDKWERIGCRPGRKLVLPGPPAYSEVYPLTEPAGAIEVEALPPERE